MHVEYLGLIAKLTGENRDQFTIQKGANVESLLIKVFSRHESLGREKGTLFIAVNQKALSAHPPAWREHRLHDGDRVMLTVRIIGG